MVMEKQRKDIKNVIGAHYTSEVLKTLSSMGVTNKKGNPYSAKMIRAVFNNKRANPTIEEAILKTAEKTLSIIRKQSKRKVKLAKAANLLN